MNATTTTAMANVAAGQRGRRSILTAALTVACAAGVATAHGLYQVAAASRIPTAVAWLYPVITDGLALVAYAATNRLHERGRRYAAVITVLAASLSGLAQAVYLAGGLGHASTAPAALRFGVGAWPAVAAALTAHLLHLVATDPTDAAAGGEAAAVAPTRQPGPGADLSNPVGGLPYSAASFHPSNPPAEHAPVQPARTTGQVGDVVQTERSTSPEPPMSPDPAAPPPGSSGGAARPRDRAKQAAREHYHRHGDLPTVTELMEAAQVARGTAGTVLKDLRDSRPALHVVTVGTTKDTDR